MRCELVTPIRCGLQQVPIGSRCVQVVRQGTGGRNTIYGGRAAAV